MARFDDWATDREVTIDKARAFADNPELIGERFLSNYTLATTSGTTGTPGIFIIADRAMRVTSALMFCMLSAWLNIADVVRIVIRGGPRTKSLPSAPACLTLKSSGGRR